MKKGLYILILILTIPFIAHAKIVQCIDQTKLISSLQIENAQLKAQLASLKSNILAVNLINVTNGSPSKVTMTVSNKTHTPISITKLQYTEQEYMPQFKVYITGSEENVDSQSVGTKGILPKQIDSVTREITLINPITIGADATVNLNIYGARDMKITKLYTSDTFSVIGLPVSIKF